MGKSAYNINGGIIFKVCCGDIDNATLFKQEAAYLNDPAYPNAPKILADITTARFFELTPADYPRIAEMYGAQAEKMVGARVALIASEEYEKGRLYEYAMRSKGINVIVFTNIIPACTWLGISYAEAAAWINKTRDDLNALNATHD